MRDDIPTEKDLAPLAALLTEHTPSTLREIAEHLFVALLLHEPAKPSAERARELAALALAQLERLCVNMGGFNWYLHKGAHFRLTRRNKEMCERFRGSYRILARAYDLTEQQVRNIVDAWQHEEFLRKQTKLF